LLCLSWATATAAPTVELLRDSWGTPHVFAASEADGFFGLGYAAAEDRLLQMELIRRKAAGRLAGDGGMHVVGGGDYDRINVLSTTAPYLAECPAVESDAPAPLTRPECRSITFERTRCPSILPPHHETQTCRAPMNQPSSVSRRSFLKAVGAVGLGTSTLPAWMPSRALAAAGANRRLNLALIGCGGRLGWILGSAL
jgi:hypothetical protein